MTEAMTNALRELIDGLDHAKSVLASDGQDYIPRAEDIADMLWLATQMESGIATEDEPEPENETADDAPIAPDNREPRQTIPPPATAPTPPPEPVSEPLGLLSTQAPTNETAPVDRLRVPAAAALRQKLELIRALRPLARRVDSRTEWVIDEEATAIALADENNPIGVVVQPRRERWLDLELVIEQSRIASLWNRAGKEWADLLVGSGLFRSVRVWTIEAAESETVQPLRLASGPPRADRDRATRRANPKELIDPTGRRLVVLLSDCLSSRWWNGEIQPVLADWSSKGPMVVVQWFPPKPYWDRTALKLGDELRLTAIAPGLPSHLLDREYPGLNPELDLDWFDDEDETPTKIKGAIVPVVSLEPTALRSWSRLVAGYGDATVAGRRFELVWDEDRKTWQGPSKKVQRRLPESGEQRVKLFGQTASRLAQELAGLMSLAPVSPEITDLIRETLLPNAYAVHVAEVFLSGLLEEMKDGRYRFVEGAKAALRKSMTTVDERLVFRVVSRFVSEKYKLTTREFEAFLLERGVGLHELEVEVFAELRDRSKASLVRFEPFEVTYGEWEIELELKATLGLRANAEVTAVEPVFEEIEFTVAQLSEAEEVDPVEEVSETPVQQEIQAPEMPADLQVARFDYTVVTLNLDGSEHDRYSATTTGFIEVLGETQRSEAMPIQLEMVGIPGGEFLMGSPDKENGNDNEKPQHLVTVPPFYLGRVPVTQSQWRFVAGLDRIDRNLKPKPSSFSGDDLPVEQVSWEDATEFCARLSVHTGRAYRLPTEAEWEYACRAGTTTPFHFGETLNTDVANYDGNHTYGSGQEGQYRQKTTPVGSLDAANAWGLLDMHGNVWEWCEDDWHSSYDDAPTDGNAWLDSEISTENVDENRTKVLRGGSWSNDPRGCRSAYRVNSSRDNRDFLIGFRVACAAPRLS